MFKPEEVASFVYDLKYVVIVVVFAFLPGLCIGTYLENGRLAKQAVRNNAAHWVVDTDGNVTWKWREFPKTEK